MGWFEQNRGKMFLVVLGVIGVGAAVVFLA